MLVGPFCHLQSQEAHGVLRALALLCLALLAGQEGVPSRPYKIRNRCQGMGIAQALWSQEGDFCHRAIPRHLLCACSSSSGQALVTRVECGKVEQEEGPLSLLYSFIPGDAGCTVVEGTRWALAVSLPVAELLGSAT